MRLSEAQFQRDGFCQLSEALNPKSLELLLDQRSAMEAFATNQHVQAQTLHFMHKSIPTLKKIFTAPSLINRLAERVDHPPGNLELLGTTLYCKKSGANGTAWHQDARFIPSDSLQAITLWVPLQPITAQSAPLVFLPTSQHHCLIEQPLPIDSFPAILSNIKPVVAAPLAPGDATIHGAWTLHGSLVNRNVKVRQALIVNYLLSPLRLNQEDIISRTKTATLIESIRQGNMEALQRNAL